MQLFVKQYRNQLLHQYKHKTMYQLSPRQWNEQAERLRNLDLRLVVGFLKTAFRWSVMYPKRPTPYVVEGYRAPERQDKLYAQGRTEPGEIVTYKRGGESKHNYWPSLAADIGFLDAAGDEVYDVENYRLFYELWQQHTKFFAWGGLWAEFKDNPHFEVPQLVPAQTKK